MTSVTNRPPGTAGFDAPLGPWSPRDTALLLLLNTLVTLATPGRDPDAWGHWAGLVATVVLSSQYLYIALAAPSCLRRRTAG
jgi:hypothetical protein